ncbi:MAG: bifunctional diaminohydroxyphosphoribosylaminopyrimidine deaminase/5-amino-6-(5-phosphoribosylamino)uracil reductase RibD [Sphingomonadales bacterium]|nr:bifunctional diaminohydroxyphosphoribosylaminopyrimidine deaminase/5-amino-6-(5-phosphoribosylamino)uracil reductase RibD [Sphingomonadales bacterium]
MAAALSYARRASGQTGHSPAVGCVIVKQGRIIARGHTQPGGRPHAEAMALSAAGGEAAGADIYVTLEPCAHDSERGPACCDSVIAARPARVVIACTDPDPRTAGKGIAKLRAAQIHTETGVMQAEARAAMAGFFTRQLLGRPHVTLKLATSLDGKIALASGQSQWITGEAARAHCHLERACHDMILVGSGTLRADNPALTVRLPGLEGRSPARIMLGRGETPDGWQKLASPGDIAALPGNSLFVEGGSGAASSFLRSGLVDRILLYRAPIMLGDGKPCLGDIGLSDLAEAHGTWRLTDTRMLAKDRMEIYERTERPE